MDTALVLKALESTGQKLDARQGTPIQLILVGGAAGMLSNELDSARTTGDCDVIDVQPASQWINIQEAAAKAGAELGLREPWLNQDARMWLWALPPGWRGRCRRVAQFGALDVHTISRVDLMALKVIGAPSRPQDREDLKSMRPTADEIRLLEAHLDRLTAEDLDRRTFDQQRAIVNALQTGE